MTTIVNSRETYLKFRQDWRNKYKALSVEIRDTKRIARAKAWTPERPIERDDAASGRAQSRLPGLRARAREMMKDLESVKAARPIRKPEQIAA